MSLNSNSAVTRDEPSQEAKSYDVDDVRETRQTERSTKREPKRVWRPKQADNHQAEESNPRPQSERALVDRPPRARKVKKTKGGKPSRSNKREALVTRALQDEVAALRGEKDAIIESVSTEVEERVNAILDTREASQTPAISVEPKQNEPRTYYLPIERVETKIVRDPFGEYVEAHFASYGYTSKAWDAARANLYRWKTVSKSKLSIPDCVNIIDQVYMSRTYRLSAWAYVKGWWQDFKYNLTFNKPFIFTSIAVVLGLGGLAIRAKKSRAALAAGFALYRAYKVLAGSKKPLIKTKSVTKLMDFCTNHPLTNEQKVDEGAEVKMCPESHVRCKSKPLNVGFSFGIDYIWIPRNCTHNEMNALVTRQLQPRIPVTEEGKEALYVARGVVAEFLGHNDVVEHKREDWLEEFLRKYPQTRREQIRRSLENTMIIDPRVSGFPKIEVMTGKPVHQRKVRFISGFSDGYLAETGPEYYLWQKAMIKRLWDASFGAITQKFVYTGGMLADQIGAWFQLRKDQGWTILLLDMSKFDSRNKEEILELLYSYYRTQFTDELYDYLEQTFHKFGKTKSGIQFNVNGTVASGRIDTSFGNTIIVFMCAVAIMHMLDWRYLEQLEVSALGDDNNLALPEFRHTIEDVKRVSAHIGHEADGMIVDPSNYHLLEYCSQRVWQITPFTSCLGPKVGRVLAKTFVCHKHVPDHRLLEHIAGVMIGFKHYLWVPVFRAVYTRFFEVYPKVAPKRYYGDDNPYRIVLKEDVEVDDESVLDQFEQIYGFRAEDLENEIMTLDFKMGDCYSSPMIDIINKIDGVSYDFEQRDVIENLRQHVGRVGFTLHGSNFH